MEKQMKKAAGGSLVHRSGGPGSLSCGRRQQAYTANNRINNHDVRAKGSRNLTNGSSIAQTAAIRWRSRQELLNMCDTTSTVGATRVVQQEETQKPPTLRCPHPARPPSEKGLVLADFLHGRKQPIAMNPPNARGGKGSEQRGRKIEVNKSNVELDKKMSRTSINSATTFPSLRSSTGTDRAATEPCSQSNSVWGKRASSHLFSHSSDNESAHGELNFADFNLVFPRNVRRHLEDGQSGLFQMKFRANGPEGVLELSPSALHIESGSRIGCGHAAALSEALSFELFARLYDANLSKMEHQIDYKTQSTPKIDYVCTLFGRKTGVSVTRLYDLDGADTLLSRKVEGALAAVACAKQPWEKTIVFVWMPLGMVDGASEAIRSISRPTNLSVMFVEASFPCSLAYSYLFCGSANQ